jgi:hypothetical protein
VACCQSHLPADDWGLLLRRLTAALHAPSSATPTVASRTSFTAVIVSANASKRTEFVAAGHFCRRLLQVTSDLSDTSVASDTSLKSASHQKPVLHLTPVSYQSLSGINPHADTCATCRHLCSIRHVSDNSVAIVSYQKPVLLTSINRRSLVCPFQDVNPQPSGHQCGV